MENKKSCITFITSYINILINMILTCLNVFENILLKTKYKKYKKYKNT